MQQNKIEKLAIHHYRQGANYDSYFLSLTARFRNSILEGILQVTPVHEVLSKEFSLKTKNRIAVNLLFVRTIIHTFEEIS
jgi:hypothetical protein